MINKKYFQFDINKCVGCHACVVACSIENKTSPDLQWREITSFNPSNYPDIPLFHYSLACNHCEDAPCMLNCPALAYSRDGITGAIIHHAEKCIGCKYCTWACPYDAPKFNPRTRIIEKCTFCNSRINEGLKPACANLCPTGALDFIESPLTIDNQNIPGFTEIGIKPSIKIIPPAKSSSGLICSEPQIIMKQELNTNQESKIELKHEWPLLIFTLTAALLVSAFTASIFTPLKLNSEFFAGAGIFVMFLSLFHLGRKLRAWRSMLNLKHSWLSREIFFFSLFWVFSSIYLFFFPGKILAHSAIVFGLLSLFSMDKVYHLAIQSTKFEIHSAHVFLSFFLFTAIFLGNNTAFLIMAFIKSGLYINRKLEMGKMKKNYRLFLTAWRLDMILSFPFIFWLFDFSNIFWWVFISVLIGEIIDRAEYYNELDIITPKKQIEMDLKHRKTLIG